MYPDTSIWVSAQLNCLWARSPAWGSKKHTKQL